MGVHKYAICFTCCRFPRNVSTCNIPFIVDASRTPTHPCLSVGFGARRLQHIQFRNLQKETGVFRASPASSRSQEDRSLGVLEPGEPAAGCLRPRVTRGWGSAGEGESLLRVCGRGATASVSPGLAVMDQGVPHEVGVSVEHLHHNRTRSNKEEREGLGKGGL